MCGLRASIVLFVKLRSRVTGGAILIGDKVNQTSPPWLRSVGLLSAGAHCSMGTTPGRFAACRGVATGGSHGVNHGEPVSALPTRI